MPSRRIINPVGSTVKKYTSAITIGAIIEPSKMPNLNQSLFGRDNTLGTTKASNKNTADTIKAQTYSSSELVNGYSETIKNTIENTMPKDFGDGCLTILWIESLSIYLINISNYKNRLTV